MAEAKEKDAAAVAGAGAGAGNMVAEAKKKKKKMKMVRLSQAYIDAILEVYPFKPFPCDPEELEKTIEDPQKRELLRSMTASVAATVKACRAQEEAIVQQYYAKGYAEEEIEVSDDDGDVEDGSEGPSDAQRQEENGGATIVGSEETSTSLCSLSKM